MQRQPARWERNCSFIKTAALARAVKGPQTPPPSPWQQPLKHQHEGNMTGNGVEMNPSLMHTLQAHSATPADRLRHKHHLPKGALSQDFTELELPRIGLFWPLLHMMSDVDLFDGHIILQHKHTTWTSHFVQFQPGWEVWPSLCVFNFVLYDKNTKSHFHFESFCKNNKIKFQI